MIQLQHILLLDFQSKKITLEQSSSEVTSNMTLPPRYHQESKYNATNSLSTSMKSYNLSTLIFLKPKHSNFLESGQYYHP